jgi:hypothetical protein
VVDEPTVAAAHQLAHVHTTIDVCPTGTACLASLLAHHASGIALDNERLVVLFTGATRHRSNPSPPSRETQSEVDTRSRSGQPRSLRPHGAIRRGDLHRGIAILQSSLQPASASVVPEAKRERLARTQRLQPDPDRSQPFQQGRQVGTGAVLVHETGTKGKPQDATHFRRPERIGKLQQLEKLREGGAHLARRALAVDGSLNLVRPPHRGQAGAELAATSAKPQVHGRAWRHPSQSSEHRGERLPRTVDPVHLEQLIAHRKACAMRRTLRVNGDDADGTLGALVHSKAQETWLQSGENRRNPKQ